MNRLVSIIVPVYNVEVYLEECLCSIMNQTYNAIEIILVNDGSTDGSYDICLKYENKDKRFCVINKENGGLSSARNAGLAHAHGEYVSFIDSDDFVDPVMIETLVNLLESESADISCCNYSIYDEDSNPLRKHKLFFSGTQVYDCKKSVELLLGERHFKCFMCNKLYKKALFQDVAFPEGKMYEDIITQYKLLNLCNKLAFCDRDLYHYRMRSGSITTERFDEKNYQMLDPIRIISYQNADNAHVLWGCTIYYLYFIDDMIRGGIFDEKIYKEYCDLYDAAKEKGGTKELFGQWRKIQLYLCRKNLYVYKTLYKLLKNQ